MSRIRMHVDEVETSRELVRSLIADQFPDWDDLPIELVDSYGTDHDIYRVGESLSARLPRIGWATAQAVKEAEWLPRLAPQLPLSVPRPLAVGRPGHDYPFEWSMHSWLPGANSNIGIVDIDRAAVDLARFIRALRAVDTAGAHERPAGRRGAPLHELDAQVRAAVAALGGRIDGDLVSRVWDDALTAPVWDGREVWVHGDLLPGNLLVVDDRLSAVIDWGGFNVGDPACDLQPAWNTFGTAGRDRFRSELAVDDASWRRGRGWALAQAVVALPYYWDTNPGMIRQATNALEHVLADTG